MIGILKGNVENLTVLIGREKTSIQKILGKVEAMKSDIYDFRSKDFSSYIAKSDSLEKKKNAFIKVSGKCDEIKETLLKVATFDLDIETEKKISSFESDFSRLQIEKNTTRKVYETANVILWVKK